MPTCRRNLYLAFLLVGFVALAGSRRWQEFTCPQVWCEDWVVIQNFAAYGWHSVLMPLNGYLVVAPKLLTRFALAVSLPYYPLVSAVIATLFSGLVGVAVAFSPTQLRSRALCGAALFVVPCGPEVFGLPLYALWWAPILVLLVALWEDGDSYLGLRVLFIALGALSSPLGLVVLPVLLIRAAMRPRGVAGWVVAATAGAAGAVQTHFLLQGHPATRPTLASVFNWVVPKYCGWYVAGNLCSEWVLLWSAGLLLVGLVGAGVVLRRRESSLWVLLFLWAGSIAASSLRADPSVVMPASAGPRYFFIPYLLTSWLLLQLVASPRPLWLRVTAAAVMAAAALNTLPVWSRGHVDMDWRTAVRSAPLFPSYRLPIETDGRWDHAWSFYLPRGQWLALRNGGLDHRWTAEDAGPTFAYRVVEPHDLPTAAPHLGAGASIAFISGCGGPKNLRLSPEGRIQFRSGSDPVPICMAVVGQEREFVGRLPIAPDWVTLEFSNAKLGQRLALEVGRPGAPVGEWREMR